jgi:hypothetical protein
MDRAPAFGRCGNGAIYRALVAAGVARPMDEARSGHIVFWLNAERREVAVAASSALLLELLAASGIPYRLQVRAWQDAALADEPLLVAVGELAGPLEIVHNGQLAPVGVAHLRVRPGDEVVIGQPAYLRRRFAFFV